MRPRGREELKDLKMLRAENQQTAEKYWKAPAEDPRASCEATLHPCSIVANSFRG